MSQYIRIDGKNRIIAGFSDAFEQPKSGDICILDDPQQAQRQFMLMGQFNPNLTDARGLPLYKYENGTVQPTTDADNADLIAAQQAAAASAPPTIEERINLIQSALDDLILGGV